MNLEETVEKEHRTFTEKHPRLAETAKLYGRYLADTVKNAYKHVIGQLKDTRLYKGLFLDALGDINYFADAIGPGFAAAAEIGLDPIVGGLQVKAIADFYKKDLNWLERFLLQVIGFTEETIPFATDWIPTMTIANTYVHVKKTAKKQIGLMKGTLKGLYEIVTRPQYKFAEQPAYIT
ncbi:hypothetical protein JXB41_02290 [Candidatus Woesearchaeota archaeon]|nr:hypothetical protein [Candidatus Woesearchaeota archaeon]